MRRLELRPRPSRAACVAVVAALALLGPGAAVAAAPSTGVIAQKRGNAGCTRVASIDSPDVVAVSPDGHSVYIGSFHSSTLTILDRDATGALHPKAGRDGCIVAGGSRAPCRRARIAEVSAIAVAPDGRSVYVATSRRVVVFDRDLATGVLREKAGTQGCVSDAGEGRCAQGRGLGPASGVTVSPDGRSVYVASHDGVATFDRDPATGALTQKRGRAGCFTETGSRGRCRNGTLVRAAAFVAVSADGRSLYAASDGIAVFDRDVASGDLRQKRGRDGCVSDTGSRGACANGKALRDPGWVAISADGRNVYAASRLSNAVAVFDRR